MDKRTQQIITRMGKDVKQENDRTSTYVNELEDDKQELLFTREKLRKKLRYGGTDGADDDKVNLAAAKRIDEMLGSGMYDKTKRVVNEEYLDRLWEAKIKKAVARGQIKLMDLKKDPFYQKIMKKQKHD